MRERGLRRSGHLGAAIVIGLAAAPPVSADDPPPLCFDFDQRIDTPLQPPLPLVEGRASVDFGTYPSGVDWASHRTVLDQPIGALHAKLLDHRNVKDMAKTTLKTTELERPGYLQFHMVDVVVSIRSLLVRMKVAWTEAWAYCLVEGTAEEPRKIVISYQKVAGTKHIRRQCGSYVLTARDDGTTDLSMYEEVKASRRSAKDTRDMHLGILRNLRGS
jgi:hypothetical protein